MLLQILVVTPYRKYVIVNALTKLTPRTRVLQYFFAQLAHLLRNPRARYRGHMSLPLVPILSIVVIVHNISINVNVISLNTNKFSVFITRIYTPTAKMII
jgi:hypothetical protein